MKLKGGTDLLLDTKRTENKLSDSAMGKFMSSCVLKRKSELPFVVQLVCVTVHKELQSFTSFTPIFHAIFFFLCQCLFGDVCVFTWL